MQSCHRHYTVTLISRVVQSVNIFMFVVRIYMSQLWMLTFVIAIPLKSTVVGTVMIRWDSYDCCCNLLHFVFTTTTTVLRPFIRDYPGELVPEETFPCHFLGFMVQGMITDADTPTIQLDNPTCLS